MKANIPERLSALRKEMGEHKINAYIIPSSDPHLSEYPADRWKAREWISGFSGSAGTVVVTADKAGLWTDSRYFLQAADQLMDSGIDLYRMALPGTPSIPDFLLRELKEGDTLGLDGQTYSVVEARSLGNVLERNGIRLETSLDLLDRLWKDRPSVPSNPLFDLPTELSGQSTVDKIESINDLLEESGANCTILSALDDIAWTFNIRGTDVAYNPVVVSYAFLSLRETVLFVQPGKLTREVTERLVKDGVTLADYGSILPYLSRLSEKDRILIDPNKTNQALFDALPSACRIIEALSPAATLKSVKNATELKGFREAMVKDGVALSRFFRWMEQEMSAGKRQTEMSVSRKLTELRAEQSLYVMDSFGTISGYAAHGAIVHYNATPDTDAVLCPESLLLIDSGAQYFDGTTDITRTISLGSPTEAMKKDYTRVLKGMISLAKSKFPMGTRGSQLDILARKALWDCGINYLHGTGHGIGHCLNVHEGPQSIRMEENAAVLMPGMVISDEPGIYRAGEYGIRIENMITVREDSETEFGKFLSFETLTLCFIDTTLVVGSMLSAREKAWLNRYHEMVYEKLSPHLDEEEKEWLKRKTTEI